MRKLLAITSILLLAAACTGDKNQPVSADNKDSVNAEINLKEHAELYTSWDEYYSKYDLSFSLDSFMKSDTVAGELHIRSYIPTDSFYRLFGGLITYNSDSSKFIDAYSTSWIIEADSDGKLHGREGEPDQEVCVIDLKKNTRTRLLFCGPGCQVQKVFWYNEDVVGIMGLMSDYADEYYTPVIWFVNISNGLTIPYEYNSTISIIHAEDYMKKVMERSGITLN